MANSSKHADDVIFTEDSLLAFIKKIRNNIKDNLMFASTSDMLEKETSEYTLAEQEIARNFSDLESNHWEKYHPTQICIINNEILENKNNLNNGRYTWIRGGSLLKFRPEVDISEEDRNAGTIYVEENNGAKKHVVLAKGFTDNGDYESYFDITSQDVDQVNLTLAPVDDSGKTRYFIIENEKYIGILPSYVQQYVNNNIPVYQEKEDHWNKIKKLKTNIITCDNLNTDTLSFNNIDFNSNTKFNIKNSDEAFRYVSNISSTATSSYNYTKIGVGLPGDYIYNNEVFATLVDVPKNSVVRIKNPVIQDWTVDKELGNYYGAYSYNGISLTLYKQIVINYKDEKGYSELQSGNLLPTSRTLSIRTSYQLKNGNNIAYTSEQLKDDATLKTTQKDISKNKISSYPSNLEYANDIQQYKFLLEDSTGVTVNYKYPLITGDKKVKCEKDKLYFTASEFYINDDDTPQSPVENPEKLYYNKEIIGVKKEIQVQTDEALKTIRIENYTLPIRPDLPEHAYSQYNTYDKDKLTESITQPSNRTSTSYSNQWNPSKTAYKHFLKIKTIDDQIIELTEDSHGNIYDLSDIKSFILEKRTYTTNTYYQYNTTTYTYKSSETSEILKENIANSEILAFITENVNIPKYQYLESWSKNTDPTYDSNKTYYKKADDIYTEYKYDIDTWKDALGKGQLYVQDNNNNKTLVTPNTELNYVKPKDTEKYYLMTFSNYRYMGEASWAAALEPDDNGKINMYIFNSQTGVMDQIAASENKPSYQSNYYVFSNIDNNNKEQFTDIKNKSDITDEELANGLANYSYYKKVQIGETSNYYYAVIDSEQDFNDTSTIYQFKESAIYNGGATGFDSAKENGNYYYLDKDNETWRKVVNSTTYNDSIIYRQIFFSKIDSVEGLKNNSGILSNLIEAKNLFQQQGSGNSYVLVPNHATWDGNLIYARLVTDQSAEYEESKDNEEHSNWKASVRQGRMWLDLYTTRTDNKKYHLITNEYQYDHTKTYYERAVNDYIKDIDLVDSKNYYIYYHYNEADKWAQDYANVYLKNNLYFKDNLTNIYEQAIYDENTYYDVYGNFYTRAVSTSTETVGDGIEIEPGVGQGEFDARVEGSITTLGGIAARKSIKGYKVHGAVFNDYAEYRHTENIEPGRCVIETGNGDLILSNKRLQLGANIISDTYGFSIGETQNANTPIAVCGRVLAYPWEFKETFMPGQAVCSGPNGTISKMTREEVREWPDAIVGYVSEIPTYKEWGSDKIKVDGRIWIKVH